LNNRKNQNSILFLTTLGVYLGLVLVGATPQVLAHAATTRTFDISEESGQVENLDKDPAKRNGEPRSVATKIRRSVSAFLAEFTDVNICGSALNPVEQRRNVQVSEPILVIAHGPLRFPLTTILSPQHLARASI
jgi:hypothetical protein